MSSASRLSDLIVPEEPLTPAERMDVALDLAGFAEEMLVARWRREQLSEEDIETRLRVWLAERPMDAPGREVTWSSVVSKRR